MDQEAAEAVDQKVKDQKEEKVAVVHMEVVVHMEAVDHAEAEGHVEAVGHTELVVHTEVSEVKAGLVRIP